ncbi:hypothetical protein [Flyfo microvirus Tbat2_171]|nr:hypothetical protein [Flyfo microvirus Tbat2_171]
MSDDDVLSSRNRPARSSGHRSGCGTRQSAFLSTPRTARYVGLHAGARETGQEAPYGVGGGWGPGRPSTAPVGPENRPYARADRGASANKHAGGAFGAPLSVDPRQPGNGSAGYPYPVHSTAAGEDLIYLHK